MRKIAEDHGASVAQVALAWVLANAAVTSVIIGARELTQLDDNLGAVELSLSDDELQALDEVSRLPVEYPVWMDVFPSDRRPGEIRRFERAEEEPGKTRVRGPDPRQQLTEDRAPSRWNRRPCPKPFRSLHLSPGIASLTAPGQVQVPELQALKEGGAFVEPDHALNVRETTAIDQLEGQPDPAFLAPLDAETVGAQKTRPRAGPRRQVRKRRSRRLGCRRANTRTPLPPAPRQRRSRTERSSSPS